jgi:predicted branched-subunit amino acid permease
MSQLDNGATVLAAALAAVLVNARFVVYGAALAHRFSGQPAWFRRLGPWFVVDQTYALVADGAPESNDQFRRFYLGAAVFLFCVWSGSVAAGIIMGPVLPAWLPLEFVLPAMFVALVVPGLQRRGELLAALTGALLAVALASPLALGAAAIAGAMIASHPHQRSTP